MLNGQIEEWKKVFFPLGYEYKRNYFTAGDLQSNLKEKFCQFFFCENSWTSTFGKSPKKSDCV